MWKTGYQIPAEFSEHKHLKGAVASARQGDEVNPEKKSSGSQFYICLDDQPNLDEGGYTVWGKVIQGMDVVLDLRQGDLMQKITIREKQ
jgi:peptidyl-prolyl cis-trans isomerase B (cyclophilin B)